MGRVIGIDWGKVRIGIALSDTSKFLASPLKTLQAAQKLPETVHLLLKEFEAIENLESIVIGLPLMLSGAESPLSEEVRALKVELEKSLSTPIILWDERLTTAGVERAMRESGVKRKKRAQVVDTLAACAILQGYLDSNAHK